jgi:hypothetical protein
LILSDRPAFPKQKTFALYLINYKRPPEATNSMMKFRFSARRSNNKTRLPSSKGKYRPDDVSSISSDVSTTSISAAEKNTKYECGDTSRNEFNVAPSEADMSKYGYEDCSPSKMIAAKYDYGVEPPAGFTRSSATPKRSSMKHGDGNSSPHHRRASIGDVGEIEVNLTGKREPLRRRISISFSEEDQVNEIVPVESLTDEPERFWIQEEEYSVIKKKMCNIIHAVKRGETSTKKYCTRGLEGHFGEGAQCKEVSRGTAWDAVLLEQHIQQTEGNFDDEGISMMYRLSSIESKIRAAQRGTRDESEVEHYQKDTRRRVRRMSM